MQSAVILFTVLTVLFVPLSVSAANQVDDMTRHIISGQCAGAKVSSAQEWLDGTLTSGAGQTSEWYVLSLAQSGEDYDFSRYQAALAEYARDNTVSAVTRQKYALLLAATGSTDGYIASVMNDTIGKQGVMSLVYGLHLLNNGYQSETVTAESIKRELLSLQLEDGGWALMGQAGDTDVTTMALQALAPYYSQDEAVVTAVDAALTLLASRQTENGDCVGMGQPCAESTAQVITALSSLGIDCQTDARFIKNGHTLFDGLVRYQTESGYCHTIGDKDSIAATSQALYALTAYRRLTSGKSGLYILDHRRLDLDTTPLTRVTTATTVSTTAAAVTPPVGSYKPIATVVVIAVGMAGVLLLILLKKTHIKNIMAVVLFTAAAVAVVWLTTFESADDYYGTPPDVQNAVGTVTVSIDSTVLENGRVILPPTSVPLQDGDTVYDVLVKVAKEHALHIDVRSGYVAGIDQLYEFDNGDLSGWVFFVNGKEASVGCDAYTLLNGDTVEWKYTCQLGNDL